MKKWWLILVALWKIAVWKVKKDVAIQKKRDGLKKEISNAIKTGDTRSLHRTMSGL